MSNYDSGQNKFDRHFKKDHITIDKHKNSIKRLFALYSEYSNMETIDFWCSELDSYPKQVVDDAVREIHDSSTSFPSMKELKDRCARIKPTEIKETKKKQEEDISKQAEVERKQFQRLRKAFVLACEKKNVDPEQSLKLLVENWFKSQYGESAVMNGFGFSIKMYERLALSDLNKNKHKSE